MIEVRIQEAPLNGAGTLLSGSGARAVAEFRGVVGPDCSFLRVTFEDEGRALTALRERAEEAAREFHLKEAVLVHRKGLLAPGDTLTCAAAAADHREEALRAVDYMLAGLKGLARKEEGQAPPCGRDAGSGRTWGSAGKG